MKYSIVDLITFATNKTGYCLSITYNGIKSKYIWKCSESTHEPWKATWDNIRQGKWCPTCSHQTVANLCRHSIIDLQSAAANKGGLCLSIKYINCKTKYKWQCKEGHVWKATADHITTGTWCPTCAGHDKPAITILQNLAQANGGTLLSTECKNAHTKLKWQCSNGHIWLTSRAEVKRGKWCPECSSFKTERQCSTILNNITGLVFKKTRFNYNGNRYEFDGYNEEHKIVFEYHGIQHYIYPNYWHKTEDIFKAAQQRDKDKEQYCKEKDITLLIIPYTVKDFYTYINVLLEKENILVSNG